MRVLVVEDDPTAASLLGRELDQLGYDVAFASDGRAALALLGTEEIPLVLTDWRMPEMDGLELCRSLRAQQDRNLYHYVILLTAHGSPEHRDEAMAARVDDYITKPYDRRELVARLSVARRVLEMQARLRRQNDELFRSQEELVQANLHLTEATEIAEIARNRSTQLFEDLPVAGFTCDVHGIIFEWNQRAEKVFGTPAHAVLGREVWEVLGGQLMGKSERKRLRRVFEGESFEDSAWSDGQIFLLVSSHPIYDRNRTVVGAVTTAVDVTAQRRAEMQIERQKQDLLELNGKLKALAVTDGLTGIPNHRAFQERLQMVTARGQLGPGFSLALFDIDHFKIFNDTFGHPAGDEVLRRTAECVAANLRSSDFIARYGGEEFALLFERVDESQAVRLCERLREQIERIENPYRRITASFGVATYAVAATSPEELLAAADQALYRAKGLGRNRVCGHSDLTESAA